MDRIGIVVELSKDDYAIKQLREILSLKKELEKGIHIGKIDDNALSKVEKQLKEILVELKEISGKPTEVYVDVNYNGQGLRELSDDLSSAERQAYTLRDVLGGLGDAFSTIGSGLQSIGGIFDTDVVGYAKQQITHLGVNALFGNLDKAQERYDIMSTFNDYLAIMGVTSEQASASLDKINQNIQGLPVGLDEAAFQTRKYNMYLDDINKATDLAIGLNKALTAGGASAQMKNYAKFEIDRLLAAGELNNIRQWRSLIEGLGVSVEFLKEDMGYAEMSNKEFIDQLSTKKITAEEFLNGLIGLGDSENLDKAIQIYRGTLESGLSNIKFAITRGQEHVLGSINDTLKKSTGKGLSEYLYDVRDYINDVFSGISDWIAENPEELLGAIERIKGFADRLRQFDWARLAKDVIGGAERLFDIVTWIYDHFPKGAIRWFTTFSLVWASPLGKAFTRLGGLFTILSRFPVVRFGGLRRSFRGFNRLMPVMRTTFKGIGKGFLGATAVVGVIAEIGAVIYEYTKIAEAIAKADFKGFDKNIGTLLKFLGGSSAVGGGMVALFSALTGSGIGGMVVAGGEALTAGMVGIIGEIGAVIQEYVDIASSIAKAKMPSDAQLKRVEQVIEQFDDIFAATNETAFLPKHKIKRMNAALDLVNSIADSIDNFEKIGKAKFNYGNAKSMMERFVKIVDDINDLMKGDFWAGDVIGTKNKAKIVENMSAVIDNFGTLSEKLLATRDKLAKVGDVDDVTGKLIHLVEKVGELKKKMDEDFGWAFGSRVSSGNQSKIVENMNSIIDGLNDTVGKLTGLKDKINLDTISEVSLDLQSTIGYVRAIVDKITDSATILGELFDLIKVTVKEKIVGKYTEAIEAISGLATAIQEAAPNIEKTMTDVNLRETANSIYKLIDYVEEAMDGISNRITALGTAMEAAKWDDKAKIISSLKSGFEDIFSMLHTIKNNLTYTNWIDTESFNTQITNIETFVNRLAEIKFDDINDINTTDLVTNMIRLKYAIDYLEQMIPQLRAMSTSLQPIIDKGIIGEEGGTLNTLVQGVLAVFNNIPDDVSVIEEKANSLKLSVDKVIEMITAIGEINKKMKSALGEGKDKEGSIQRLSKIVSSITKAFSGGDEEKQAVALENLTSIADTITKLKDAFAGLTEIDLAAFYGELENTKVQVTEVKDACKKLKNQLKNVAQNSATASMQLIILGTTAGDKAGAFEGLIQSIRRVALAASNAAAAISALRAQIAGLQDKTVTVTVNKHTELLSSGGKIAYRARGGSVHGMRPRGTDTVPAMLTPGEWVIRRSASRAFGDAFMQKINNMDIPGAMDALMQRSRWNPMRSGNITNNYDNHATVNQYFDRHADNRSSYRRASRYVEAL